MSPNLYYDVVYQLFLTLYFTYYNDVRSHEWARIRGRPFVKKLLFLLFIHRSPNNIARKMDKNHNMLLLYRQNIILK